MTASTVFRRVQVFDGREVIKADSVLVSDGVIAGVGHELAAPPDAVVIDGEDGRTLLPGLIDAHTHQVGQSLARAIVFGVTTELDMASLPSVIRQAKGVEAGPETGLQADVRSAGHGAGAPGGHGSEFFGDTPKLSEPEEAGLFVAARVAEGSDYIKIHYKDGQRTAKLAGRDELPVLRRETMAAVAAAAARRERLSLVHIGTQEGAVEAVEAGVNGLAHIFVDGYPDPAFAPLLVRRRSFVIPTLVIAEGLGGGGELPLLASDERLGDYLDDGDRTLLRMVAGGQIPRLPVNLDGALAAVAAVAAVAEAGVPVLAGSDMSQALHGAGLHRELELLVRAALSPARALSAATATPAEVFWLSDRGRIAPGLRADLVLVEGDPVTSITASRAIAGVWKRGVRVDRDRRGPVAPVPASPVPASGVEASGAPR